MMAHWVLHDRAPTQGASEGAEEPEPAPTDLKSVSVRFEGSVPTGCQVTIDLNGEPSVLQPGGGAQKSFASRKRSAVAVQERKFGLAPLGSSTQADREPLDADEDEDAALGEDAESETAADRVAPAGERRQRPQEADAGERGEPATPASLAARVMLDCSELNVRTAQELLMPEIEIMEILDTAVVLRLSQLTGDRFELTVYASGGSSGGGSAATLVQEGPVRSPEAMHRVGQLESSQVYVAWVKVFCEGQALESQQKGFKTLPPRVLTIWDKPDHEILGVDKMATSKEIIKAWRMLSLQFHPDKETDPEKKEDAEEMMKRLNIAKQNMLRSCPTSTDPETPTPDAGSGQPNGFGQDDDPFGGPGGAGYFSDSNVGSDDDWKGDAPWPDDMGDGAAGHPGSSRDRGQGAGGAGDPASQAVAQGADGAGGPRDALRCSLRVEAPKPPKLKVVERLLTTLVVEASGLPIGAAVEVQRFLDDRWQSATRTEVATASTLQFTISDLEENQSYRLRLRTTLDLDPILLTFAEFAAQEEEEEELVDDDEADFEGEEEEEDEGDAEQHDGAEFTGAAAGDEAREEDEEDGEDEPEEEWPLPGDVSGGHAR